MDFQIDNIGAVLTAIAALGAAAFGLVDACKALPGGGLSRLGFRFIRDALRPYGPCLDRSLGSGRWEAHLMSHWIGGRALDEQKAIARSLIRLGLAPDTVARLPDGLTVDKARLAEAAAKLVSGQELSETDLNLLGRLDATLEAELQAAFDRADQRYRAAARVWAGAAAICLAVLGLILLEQNPLTLTPADYGKAFLVGILAVPIAPIAKDLSSAIAAGAKAVASLRPG